MNVIHFDVIGILITGIYVFYKLVIITVYSSITMISITYFINQVTYDLIRNIII